MSECRELTLSTEITDGETLVISDARAPVITDPLRWRILEVLSETSSVEEISRRGQVTDARALYHLERLAEVGVIRVEETGEDPREWSCSPLVARIQVREPPGEGDPEAVSSEIAADFNQAFREVDEGLYGPACQVSVNHNRARLSEAQAAKFNQRLLQLIEEYFPPGKGDPAGVKYGFYGVLTPIDLHPLRASEER